jgi:2-iminobutanoate/2-iminopropanoate deaminase
MLKPIALVLTIGLAFITPSVSQTLEKQHYTYSDFAKNSFSEVVSLSGTGRLLFLAGIGPEDPKDGTPRHQGDLYGQCKYSWDKIKEFLGKHGAGLGDIVKSTVYVTDMRYREEMRRCRADVFPAGFVMPAQTLLGVASLARPGMMIEIDIIAALSK